MMFRLGIAWVIIALAGCGFQPRGSTAPGLQAISPVYLVGRAESDPFMRELRYQLQVAGAQLADRKSEAASLLRIQRLKRQSNVFSVNSSNKALEYEVRYDLVFSFEAPPGQQRLDQQSLDHRSIVYAPGGALLGRLREAELQKADAYRDLAQRLLIRLQHLD